VFQDGLKGTILSAILRTNGLQQEQKLSKQESIMISSFPQTCAADDNVTKKQHAQMHTSILIIKLVPFTFLSAISNTFNPLFKVLFIFPSWYLFAIGLKLIFSFR
jgi:hypothetical protein